MAKLRWGLLLALAAAAPAAPPEKDPPSAERLFNSLWSKRQIVQAGALKLYMVELDPAQVKAGGATTKLRVVQPVGWEDKSFKPQDVQARIHVGGGMELADRTGSKRYLALMHHISVGKIDQWMPIQLGGAGDGTKPPYRYFLAADGFSEAFWKALNDLMFQLAPEGKGGPDGQFQRMLGYLAGKDEQVRDLAACFAGVNGWGYRDDAKAASQPDAFARVLLAAGEPKVRGWMARAYAAAGADLLPRDPGLLERVLSHPDKDVHTPALQGGLRHAAGRADALAGVIRSRLAGAECVGERRSLVLEALTGWGKRAAAFVPPLKEIALGNAAPAPTELDRVTALRLCLDADCDGAEALILDTLETVPSAVALKYAVDHEMHAVVPAVIGSTRKGRIRWSDTHAAAMVLLTRRFPDGRFEQFDAWWASVEKANGTEAAVRGGFSDPAARSRARELIARLSSDRYRIREAAMEELMKLGGGALPELEAASRSANPEVAASASAAAEAAGAQFKSLADRLEAAAGAERAGKAFLPMAE